MSKLSQEQIEAATGRELDALVAEHVMEWRRIAGIWAESIGVDRVLLAFSTDGEAMLLVLERMRELKFTFILHTRTDGGTRARFGNSQQVGPFITPRWVGEATGANLPEAVSRASLLAILAQKGVE